MDSLAFLLLGALTTLGGGLIFRSVEADQQRRHWFRDHLREAAERFLTDAQRHLDVSWAKVVGDIPDGSEAIVGPTAELEVDISRLRLVAPKAVADKASDVFTKLKGAFDAAQFTGMPSAAAKGRVEAAKAAVKQASNDLDDFADLVQRSLK